MRRLFLVLDLSLLRQQGEEQRQAVLEQLTIAVGRLWAAFQPGGGGGGAPGRHVSWGYALYDSACPELLLKPKLRDTAKALKLPAAFQETLQTDCRGAALVQFLDLIDAVTQPTAAAAADGAAPAAAGEAPAAALARALQSALSSSYLKKLQELADSDSSSGGGGRRPEGLLAVFSSGLSAAPQLLRFLGPSAEAELAAVAAAGSPREQQAGLQRLLAAALPAAVWQRCGAGGLRVSWVAADAAAAGASDEQPLPVLPALQAAMQQHCQCAAAAPLTELAGECSPAAFAARLALPQRSQGEVQQAAAGGAEGEDAVCWPAAADGSRETARAHLELLMTSLGAHKELEAAKERARAEHKQLAKQRQHQARLPTGAGGRRAALVANKGQRLLANAQRLKADKSRKGPSSWPASRQGTPEAAAMSDDQAHLLAAAANRLGGEEEEVSSGTSLAPEAAAAELKRRVGELLASTLAAERPSIASMLAQVRSLVDGCFASMLRFSSQHPQHAQQAQRAQQQASDADEAPEVTSAPAGTAGTAGEGHPRGLDAMRALLLQHAPVAVADLRRQHMAAEQVEERRQVSHRFLLELLLRLSICAYGVRPGGSLPVGQYEEVEVLMQCVVATLQPIPDAGHEVFLHILKPAFGARFRSDMQKLQSELWDEDMSLDVDSLQQHHDQHLKELENGEKSGETPGCSEGGIHSGSMLTGSGPTGRTGPAALPAVPAAAAGPSNLGRSAAAPQREASGWEGTTSGHPSAGTARPSSSAMSGENSGVQGGSGATTAAGLARSGALSARTATSSGAALMNMNHIKQRYNNTKQFELQVRSKPNLLQKGKLKHTVATSRPAGASAAPTRRAGGATTAGGAPTAGGTAGGGSSRAAAALAAATSKGRGAAAAAAAARQPRPKQQVPETPDSRGKALRSAAEAEARLARAQAQQQQQQEALPEQSLLTGGAIVSPDKSLVLLRGPGAAEPATLEAIPATDVRPPLAAVPAGIAEAAAAAAAGGGRLMRSPSMRLDFGSLPGAILPSQQKDQELPGLDGGSTSTSPIGGPLSGAATAAAAAAEGPTWMVAATRPTRRNPAVASFGALAAAGSQPHVAQPVQQPEQQPEQQREQQPDEGLPAHEQQAGMEWEEDALPTSPSQAQLPAAADADMAEAAPEGPLEQPDVAKAEMDGFGEAAEPAADAEAAAEPEAAAAEPEAAPANGRRTRSASRGRSAASAGGDASPSAATRRGRSASKAAEAAADPAQQAQQEEEEGADEAGPGSRRTTRGAAAAAAAEAARVAAPRRSGRHTPGGQDAVAAQVQPAGKQAAGSKGKGKKQAAAKAPAPPTEEAPATEQAEPALETAPQSAPRRGRSAGAPPAEEEAAAQPAAADPPAALWAAADAHRTPRTSRSRAAVAAAAADAAEEAEAQAAASIKRRQRSRHQGEAEAATAAEAPAEAAAPLLPAEQLQQQLEQPDEQQVEAAEPEAAPASGRRARSASRGRAAASAGAEPAPSAAQRRGRSGSRADAAATTPAQPAQQADEGTEAGAPTSQRTTRSGAAVAAAEAAELAAPRRRGRHTPGGAEAAAQGQPASSKPSAGKASAGSKGKGKKRAAPEAPAVAEDAPAAMEVEAAGEEQPEPAEQLPAEQPAQPAVQAAVDPSSLAKLANLLGCKRCPRSKTGCSTCRPKLAAALAEAGAEHLTAGVGQCGQGTCRSGTGCAACWAVVKHRLQDPAAAAAEAPAAAAAAAQPAAGEAEPEAGVASGEQEADAPARKRRRTRHAAAEEDGVAATPAPAADEAAAAQAAEGSTHRSKRKAAEPASGAAPEAAAPLSGQRRGRSAGLLLDEAAADAEPQSTGRRGRSSGRPQLSPAPSAEASRPLSRRASLMIAHEIAAERAAQEAAEQVDAAAEAVVAPGGNAVAAEEPMQEGGPADEAAQPAAGVSAAMDVDAAAAGQAGTPAAVAAAQPRVAPADPAAAAIEAAMDAAGALSQQLDGEDILAATIVPSPAEMSALPPAPSLGTPGPATAAAVAKAAAEAAAAAAAADQAAAAEAAADAVQRGQEEEEAVVRRPRRPSTGSFDRKPRIGLLQSSAGKSKKRSAADMATSSQPHKRSLPSADAASRSPVAALLRQAAAGGADAQLPSSPYQDAYDPFPAASAGPGAAAAAAAEGELVADSAAAHSPAGRAPAQATAAAALGAADASSPARAAPASGQPAAQAEAAQAAAQQQQQEQQEQQEQEAPQHDPQQQQQQQQLGAPGPNFAGARVYEHMRRQEQQRLAAQQAQQAQQGQQAQQEQPDEEQQHSDDSCSESAVPDSQLQQLSSPEVGGPQAAGSPAATPASRQRRLSPGGPAAGAGPKPAATAQSQQQLRQQQQQQQVAAAAPAAAAAGPAAVPKPGPGESLWYCSASMHAERCETLFVTVASIVSDTPAVNGGFVLEIMGELKDQPDGAGLGEYPYTLRSEGYRPAKEGPQQAGHWRLASLREQALVRFGWMYWRREQPVNLRSQLPACYQSEHSHARMRRMRDTGQEKGFLAWVQFCIQNRFYIPDDILAHMQAADLWPAVPVRPPAGQLAGAPAAAAQQAAGAAAAAAAVAEGGRAVPVQGAAGDLQQGGVAAPVQAAVAARQQGGVAVPVQAAAAAAAGAVAPRQGGVAVPVLAAAAVPGELDGHAVDVQPSASQPSQATLWRPAEPPGETVLHNAAARQQQQQQRRRDSLDSLNLPESRAAWASQQAGGFPDPPPSAPRRGLTFGGSPAAAHAPAPSSVARGRPPLPHGHPAVVGGGEGSSGAGLMSPNRLGSCSNYSARKGLQPSPSPLRPAAGARLHMASPQVLPLAGAPAAASQQRYAQSPGAAAAGPAAASPAQQQPRQVQQQLNWGQSPVTAGAPAAAALTPRAQQTPPAQQAQQASSYWEHFSQQLAPQLEQLPIRPYAPASPAAAGGRASSFRMAQRGDVLLHCMGTARQTGLPKLQRVLVLGVQSVNEGSPKQSHQVEIVTLAAGANASSLMHQAGQWGRIVLGKAGWMEKDEGVRSVHHWRIQGCVPPAAMVELERALQREAAAAGELA